MTWAQDGMLVSFMLVEFMASSLSNRYRKWQRKTRTTFSIDFARTSINHHVTNIKAPTNPYMSVYISHIMGAVRTICIEWTSQLLNFIFSSNEKCCLDIFFWISSMIDSLDISYHSSPLFVNWGLAAKCCSIENVWIRGCIAENLAYALDRMRQFEYYQCHTIYNHYCLVIPIHPNTFKISQIARSMQCFSWFVYPIFSLNQLFRIWIARESVNNILTSYSCGRWRC